MNIRINIAELKPDTIAQICADTMNQPQADMVIVEKLTLYLEDLVGNESAIDYLVEAGVNANLVVGLFED
jgi:hypothetical protein